MIIIVQNGIKIEICYTLNFVDGLQEVIVENGLEIIDGKFNINLYIPIEISLANAQAAIKSIKEKDDAKGSEV